MGNEVDRDSLVILVLFSQFVGEKQGYVQSFEASFSLVRYYLAFEPNLGSYQPVGRWWGGPRRLVRVEAGASCTHPSESGIRVP